jgi:hypothetical protein
LPRSLPDVRSVKLVVRQAAGAHTSPRFK